MTETTLTQQIKTLYEQGHDTDTIRLKLGEMGIIRNNHFIRNMVYRIKTNNKGLRQTTLTPQAIPQDSTAQQDKPLIAYCAENEQGDFYLYVKTSKLFEDWVKSNKEIRTTENLFNQSKTAQFYYLRFNDDGLTFDNINERVIYANKINMGVLRVVGVSEGFKIRIEGLCSENNLRTALKQFAKNYSEFYKKYVLNHKIKINTEVIIEND